VWGDAAVYVDPSDDEALVAAVDALVADEAARADLAAAAQERARTFTLDRTARGYLDVYARLPVRSR
jgi:glycosyltransferase involved in cell wall biosynthesis